jgi:6-phosphofructokinase 2
MAIVTLTMNPALDIATTTERIMPAHKLRCTPPRYDAGGGGINVARAVTALGGEAVAIFPSGGSGGEMIRFLLTKEGVPFHTIAITGFTRESLAVEERESGRQYRFILPGPQLTSRDQERCLDAVSLLAAEAPFIVASGSLPPGVPDDFFARLGVLVNRLGKRFVLDTSGPALKAVGSGIYLMKPSLRELEELTGHEIRNAAEQEQAARAVVAEGRSEIVLVSLGAAGALLATSAGIERFPPIAVAAKSTIGAGDSMLAGVVVALSRGLPLGEAVRFGIAAGAAALFGAGTALCRREDVERLYALLTSHAAAP